MPTQNCPGILQVDMRYLSDGQSVYNVFHVSHGPATNWSHEDIVSVIDQFYEVYWTANQAAMLPVTISLIEIVATDLTSLAGLKVVRAITPAEPGTNMDPGLPLNVTLAIKLFPGVRGRGRAGRIFWPNMPESAVVGDQVTSAYTADAITCITEVMTAIETEVPGTSELVVLSRVFGGAPRLEGVGFGIADVSISDNYVDSQKNRLPRHKRRRKHPAVP